MIALVTGASSGIGREISIGLARRGYDLIIAARRGHRLAELKRELTERYGIRVHIVLCNLAKKEDCLRLYREASRVRVDVLVNNAGFGVFGEFDETDLDDELRMIDVNIKSVHTLTKLFLRDFRARNSGYILNVASLAGFMAGPNFAAYYATKNYVVQLTKAIYEELRHTGSGVSVSAFCPGPVMTEFNEIAGAEFAVSGIAASEAAEYALAQMFRRKLLIVPTVFGKLTAASPRFLPTKLLLRLAGAVQRARKPAKTVLHTTMVHFAETPEESEKSEN